MKLRYLLAASVMAVSLTAGSTYDVITLAFPLPMDPVAGVNNVGQLVGTSYPSGYFIATAAGSKIPIPPPPGWTPFQANRLNDSGQVTGYGAPTGGPVQSQAFVGSTTGSAGIPLPAGWLRTYGAAINKFGQVAGYGTDANHLIQPFIGTPAGITVIPLPNGFTSAGAVDINDAGQVTGTVSSGLGTGQAYIGTSAGMTLIPLLPGWTVMGGAAINNLGEVLGVGTNPMNLSQAFVRTAAGMTILPFPPGCNSVIAIGMNDLGQVLGYCSTGTGMWIWDSVNGTRLLQDLVPSGWSIETVSDMNDLGQILTSGHFAGGERQSFLLNPASGPLIITAPGSLSSGTVGVAYGPVQSLPAHGSGGYTWSATGLPNGLTLSSTGRLSGTPATGSQGVYSPQFTVRDSSNTTVTVTRSLTVATPAPLLITAPTSLLPQKEGSGFLFQFAASGGTGGYVWSATGLPSGIAMSAIGWLSGAPATGTHGTYSLQITVRDSSNVTASVTLSLTIYPPVIVTGPAALPGGTVGLAYGPIQFTATGGTGNNRWGLVFQPLPAGLTLSAAGVLSGTPAPGSAGVYTLTFGVEDLLPNMSISAAVTLSLTIVQSAQPAPVISSVSPNPFPALNGNQLLTINGTGFQNGLGFRVHVGANDVNADFTGSQVNFLSSTQVTVLINLGTTATNRGVQVFNPDGKSSNLFFFSVAAQPVNTSFALPQIAFGGGWYTALYFSNTTTSVASIQVDFMNENGAPLSVPLAEIGSVSSRSISLNPGATVILEAPNTGATLVQGWAEASLPSGVVGYAVFRQSVSGRADQEAVVPLTPEASRTADFTYDDTDLTTSVAFVNPSNLQARVTVGLYQPDGTQIGTSQVLLGARSKQAVVLRNLPGLSDAAGKRGWAKLSVSSGSVSVLGLRFGAEAFTSIPVTHRTGAGGTTSVLALPQIAFGGGWYTALYVSNTSSSGASIQLKFVGENGLPLSVPLLGIGSVSSWNVDLNVGATAVLEAPNADSLTQGWAEVILAPGVVGYAVFRQSVQGRADQEAVVPLTSESNQTADLVYDDTSLTTSVAFVNPGNQQATVTIAIRDADGSQAGSTQVLLPPRSRQAATLKNLPGLAGAAGHRGWANFSVVNGAVSVLGLRFGAEAFTSIPDTHR
jgi:hypothetical protein